MIGRRVLAATVVVACVAAAACGSSDGEAEPLAEFSNLWRVQIGSSGSETSYGVAATPNGEVVITASTEGNLAGENQGQRDVFLARYSKELNQLWALQTGGESNDSPLGVSVAPDGSIYVGGFTDGDFAGPNQGSADVWLARFDGDGNELWRTQFGSDQWDRGFDVSAFDGGAYISGYSAGTLDPDTYLGGFDGFAARFDAEGNQQWVRQFGTDTTDWGQGSALAPDGGLYVTGYTEGDFGGPNAGDKDLFVVRLSPDGEQEWVTQLGSDALDWTQGVGLGPDGSVLVAGSTEGSFARGLGGERDMIVVSLNAEGKEQWRWQSGFTDLDSGFEVRFVDNQIVVTGTIDNLTLPEFPETGEYSSDLPDLPVVPTGRDIALAWLKPDGGAIAITTFGSEAVDEGTGLAVATDGSVYWSGYTTGSYAADSAGGSDLVLGRLTRDG